MRIIPDQEIKRQGTGEVESLVREGAIHVVVGGQPRYVVLTEERYAELMEAANDAYVARVLASDAAIARGEGYRYTSVADHMAALDAIEDDDEEPDI